MQFFENETYHLTKKTIDYILRVWMIDADRIKFHRSLVALRQRTISDTGKTRPRGVGQNEGYM
jgi:hypothetical protein